MSQSEKYFVVFCRVFSVKMFLPQQILFVLYVNNNNNFSVSEQLGSNFVTHTVGLFSMRRRTLDVKQVSQLSISISLDRKYFSRPLRVRSFTKPFNLPQLDRQSKMGGATNRLILNPMASRFIH